MVPWHAMASTVALLCTVLLSAYAIHPTNAFRPVPQVLAPIQSPKNPTIGVVLSATSRKQGRQLMKLHFIKSFGNTLGTLIRDEQYHFAVFVAYDDVDPVYSNPEAREEIETLLRARARGRYVLEWIECPYTRQPARSQNDAAMAAYRAGVDYIFRINDDTTVSSHSDGVAPLVRALQTMPIANLGVVGPTCHESRSCSNAFLTHELVHRRHIDIFGFYYPKYFKTWYADTWITRVYEPLYLRVVMSVRVSHSSGSRYVPERDAAAGVWEEIRKGRLKLRAVSQTVLLTPQHPHNVPITAEAWYAMGFQVAVAQGSGFPEAPSSIAAFLRQRGYAHALPSCSGECLSGDGVALLHRALLPGIADLPDATYVLSVSGDVLPENDVYWGANEALQRRIPFHVQAYFLRRSNRDTELAASWYAIGGALKDWRRTFSVSRGQAPNAAIDAIGKALAARGVSLAPFQGQRHGSVTALQRNWTAANAAAFVNSAWAVLGGAVAADSAHPPQISDGSATASLAGMLRSLNASVAANTSYGVVLSSLNMRGRPLFHKFRARARGRHQKLCGLLLPSEDVHDEVLGYIRESSSHGLLGEDYLTTVEAAFGLEQGAGAFEFWVFVLTRIRCIV